MNLTLKQFLALTAVAALVVPLQAADKAEKKAEKKAARVAVVSPGLTEKLDTASLTDEQKKQLEEIKTKFAGKATEAHEALANALTKEQRAARRDAAHKAKEEGKKGAEAKAAIDAAVQLTDEQNKTFSDAEMQMKSVQTEIRDAILALLTDDQKQAAGLAKPAKKKKQP